VVHTGDNAEKNVPSRPQKEMDLERLNVSQLIALLNHSNVWQRKMAQRIVSEKLVSADTNEKEKARASLNEKLVSGKSLEARLAALWTLHNSRLLQSGTALDTALMAKDAFTRSWAIRFASEEIREQTSRSEQLLDKITEAASDPDPVVRLAVATAMRELVSGSLTVDTEPTGRVPMGRTLASLVTASADAKDPLLPFMIWMAAEPSFAKNPAPGLDWLSQNGSTALPLSAMLANKAMRRLCDAQNEGHLNHAMKFLEAIAGENNQLVVATLEGLIEGQRAKPRVPNVNTEPIFTKLRESSSAAIKERGQELGALCGDSTSLKATLAAITDISLPTEQRLQSIRIAQHVKNDATREALLKTINSPGPVTVAAIQTLGQMGGESVANELLNSWDGLSPEARTAAAEVLVSRTAWAITFLSAVEAKKVSSLELPVTAIRAISQSKDRSLRTRAEQVLGRIRPANADKQKIIQEKKKMIVAGGPPNLKAGHELAQKTCLNCHKLYAEGGEVGPDLTGVGRSNLDALLANVIDPNQVIGKGYENVLIETKDGRNVSGRLVEDSDSRVKLLAAGPKEEIVAKSDIASMRISELSVMPEGLEQMPDADFRNLILYILRPEQEKEAGVK
jgi:putative heme-binding domain-containing protein